MQPIPAWPGMIRACFDACLLAEAEMVLGEAGWRALVDPFPAWQETADQ